MVSLKKGVVSLKNFSIHLMKQEEIDIVSSIIAQGYNDDIFFHWVVDKADDRISVVTNYYKEYLKIPSAIVYVAKDENEEIIGATVWLPHDVDPALYENINNVVGEYAGQFQKVADLSHEFEPKNIPFYQLVGIVVKQNYQGQGIGAALLKTQLDYLDSIGIATYLEASTPYNGDGVYSKFGYDYYNKVMNFEDAVYLYPLFRAPKTGKKTAFIYDESYFWHNAGNGALFEPAGGFIQENGSVESPESKRRVKNLLEMSGLIDQLRIIKPQPVTTTQLEYFHTSEHINRVKEMSIIGGFDCGDSAIVGRGSYEIAKLSTGGAIEAVRNVVQDDEIKNAYALTRPPGHHAEKNQGMGFCIFNNIVIAAKFAQNEIGVKKILILDWDAHHGNGTEDAFYDDDSVCFISIHQDNLEPIGRGKKEHIGKGQGTGFNYNIPLLPASGDAVYKYTFDKIVTPIVHKFKPELILISAGQDASIFDPLARMMVSADGYKWMAKRMQHLAEIYCSGRLVCLHEGGYSEAYVPFCTHAVIEGLSGISTGVKDPFIYAMAGTGYNQMYDYQKQRVDEISSYFNL